MPNRTGLVVLALALPSCGTWQAVPLAPQEFAPPPVEIRVTRIDGWRAVITSPRFEDDTVRGVRAGEPFDSIAVAAVDVRAVAVRRRMELSRDATQGLVLAGFLGSVVILFLAVPHTGN